MNTTLININNEELKLAKKLKLQVFCDYCGHDLRVEGLMCHDSQAQTNYYGNYLILINKER